MKQHFFPLTAVSLLSLLSLFSSSAFAADNIVKGKVIDAAGNPNIGIAVHIYQPADSVATSVFSSTDTEGLFQLPAKKNGEYNLVLDGIGYRKSIVPFNVTAAVTELPDIAMIEDTEMLEEVVVSARKPLIQSDGATLTYNVDEDPSSATSTTIDMLRKVPMVSVDAEDNIKVKGQSNFKIYVNGKEDPMMSGDPKSVLRSLPASSIRKIEVLTEPGAKYDAEGVGGILNIVTVSNSSIEGYLANVSAMISNQHWGVSGYGQTKINKVTASANVGYYNTSINKASYRQHNYVEYLNDPELGITYTDGKTDPLRNHNINASLNLSWEPDTLNLVTLSAYYGQYASNVTAPLYQTAFSPTGSPVYSYMNEYDRKGTGDWGGVTLSMQHNFRRPEHNLTFSYDLNFGSSDDETLLMYKDMVNISFPDPWNRTTSHNPYSKHTLQLDYTLPLRHDNDTFEAGVKAIWKPADSRKEEYLGLTEESLTLNEASVVNLHQINDVLAAYLSYNAKFNKLTARAGVRYEHTRLGYRYKAGDFPGFISRLNDLVPNAALAYNFGGSANLRLSYQLRIGRPNADQLNPYINDNMANFREFGNPDLKSSKSNSFNLSYSQYGMKFGGSFNVGYSQEDNSIVYYQFVRDGILNNTYANAGHARNLSLGGNLNWTIIKDLRLGLSTWVTYIDCFANIDQQKISNSGWSGNFNGNIDYTTPWKMRVSLNGGLGTPWIELQGKGSSWHYYNISFSRSFLKEDRLTVSLNASNFIKPRRTWHTETMSDNFRTYNSGTFSQWNIGLSLSWRLGSLSTSVKQTSNRLESDGGGQGGSQQPQGL